MSDLFARLSRVYAEAARNGKPVVGFATPRVWDEYEAELRMRGTRDDDNPHKYLWSSADALARDFPNLLFMGIPLCRDSDMAMGVRFEVRRYEPNQVVVSSGPPKARRGYRAFDSAGAGEARPAQPASSDGPRLGYFRWPDMKLEQFLLDTGRAQPYDLIVGRQKMVNHNAIGLWLDRVDRYVLIQVSGLEMVQNGIFVSNNYPKEFEVGCNPRCEAEHMAGYDILHVGPEMTEVFKKGLWGSGRDPNAVETNGFFKGIHRTIDYSGFDLLPKSAPKVEWLDVERGVFNMLPKSASKQLSGIDLSVPTAPAELQARINDAEQKRTHRKQLRMLVNERVPSHLMGADIVKVETTCNQLYIDVAVAGSDEPIRIPAARLWEHNLTVPGLVELYGGEIPAAPPVIPHPMLP